MAKKQTAVAKRDTLTGPTIRKARLADYVLDPRNANRSTLRGQSMLENSIEQFGAARSGVVDKDGVMRAGNHTAEQLAAAGIDEVLEVEATGKQWVVVKRTDMDAKQGEAYGVADNRVAQVSIDFDPDVLRSLQDDGLDLSGLWDQDELNELLRIVPDFQPVGIDEQGRLDQKKPVTCPHCGKEFTPND